MSNTEVAYALVVVVVLVVVLTIVVVVLVDRRTPRSASEPGEVRPMAPEVQARVRKAIAPFVAIAFLFGLLAFQRLWAGFAVAAIAAAYGMLLPWWLWRHVQARRLGR